MTSAPNSSGACLNGEDADHRAHRVADEDDVGELELAADLDEVGGVAAQRPVLLRVVGGQVGAARADLVEEDDAVVDLEVGGDEAPHALVAAEAVGEDDRPPAGHAADPYRIALEHGSHASTLWDARPPVAGQTITNPIGSGRTQRGDDAPGNGCGRARSVSENPCRASSGQPYPARNC